MKLTVIIVVLNEAPFITTCLQALYPFADRIFIQTGYDRSWSNRLVEPDETVPRILAFPDPAGKIALLVRRIPDEALCRNVLIKMDRYEVDHRLNNTVGMTSELEPFCQGADYYWIVDGDEIYDPRTVENTLGYLRKRKPKALFVRGLSYFRSWNYVVEPSDDFFQPGFIRHDVLFRENRNVDMLNPFRFVLNKYVKLPNRKAWEKRLWALSGLIRLPEEIGVFHHGAYVGDDTRIWKKIQFSGHASEVGANWYRDVWQKWTPASTNLHPMWPQLYQRVRHIPTSELPPVIADAEWPPGYIER